MGCLKCKKKPVHLSCPCLRIKNRKNILLRHSGNVYIDRLDYKELGLLTEPDMKKRLLNQEEQSKESPHAGTYGFPPPSAVWGNAGCENGTNLLSMTGSKPRINEGDIEHHHYPELCPVKGAFQGYLGDRAGQLRHVYLPWRQ